MTVFFFIVFFGVVVMVGVVGALRRAEGREARRAANQAVEEFNGGQQRRETMRAHSARSGAVRPTTARRARTR